MYIIKFIYYFNSFMNFTMYLHFNHKYLMTVNYTTTVQTARGSAILHILSFQFCTASNLLEIAKTFLRMYISYGAIWNSFSIFSWNMSISCHCLTLPRVLKWLMIYKLRTFISIKCLIIWYVFIIKILITFLAYLAC